MKLSGVYLVIACAVAFNGYGEGSRSFRASAEPAGTKYTIEPKFKSGEIFYYLFETDYRNEGAIISAALPLSYSETAKEKKYVMQRVVGPSRSKPEASMLNRVAWDCERYEIRDKSFGPENSFDSLRDTYPVTPLRALGSIPGSKINFLLDRGGVPSDVAVQPGTSPGPTTGVVPSPTIERCIFNPQRVKELLDLMGSYFLPKTAVAVGETWTRQTSEVRPKFGTLITDISFTLRGVRERDGIQVATIDINGKVSLKAEPVAVAPAKTPPARVVASSQPNVPNTKKPSAPASRLAGPADARPVAPAPVRPVTSHPADRDITLEKGACQGSVEYDLTHGRVVAMTLRRETSILIEMYGKDNSKTGLRSGDIQIVRIKSSPTPFPRPTIMGGPKPPVEAPTKKPVPPKTTNPHGFSKTDLSLRPVTTQPATKFVPKGPTTRPMTRPVFRAPTTQPALRAPTTQPVMK